MKLATLILVLLAASSSASDDSPRPGQSGTPQETTVTNGRTVESRAGARPLGGVPPSPALASGAGSEGPSGLTTSMPALRGTATWYCGGGSPCTRGYGPSDLVAAIDPTTGIPKGTRLTVHHRGRSVTVRIVDVCACRGRRVIDLTRKAFGILADPGRGVIEVRLTGVPAIELPETDTAQ